MTDLEQALQWYARQGEHLPARLLADIDQTLMKVSQSPELGLAYPRRSERFRRAQAFPYLIIYETRADEIYVKAIAHERRKPGYWRQR